MSPPVTTNTDTNAPTPGRSVWTAANRMWKSRRKYRLLNFMLLTQLRGMVPEVHRALLMFVWGLRQLDGQLHSYEKAMLLGILPGSRSIRKHILKRVKRDLILGLVLIEGAFPKSHLKPGVKHFVHYPRYTGSHSRLRILWMMAFERWVLLKYNLARVHNSNPTYIIQLGSTSITRG